MRARVQAVHPWSWLVCAACLFGIYLRVLGAHTDLPTPHVDENDVVDQAVAFMGGEWRYYLLEYGPLPMYLLAGIYHVLAFVHGLSPLAYASRVFFDFEEQYFVARLFCAAFYPLLAFVAYRVLAPRYGRWGAGVSSLLLALPFLDQLTGSKIRIDVPQGFFQVCAVLALVVALDSQKLRHWGLAGVCAGFGIASKPMPGLLVLPCFPLASWLAARATEAAGSSPRTGHWRAFGRRLLEAAWRPGLWLSLVVAAVTAVLGNPTSLDLGAFIAGQRNAMAYYSGAQAPGMHLNVFRASAPLGLAFLFAAGLGILGALWVRDARAWLLASFPLLYGAAFWGRPMRQYYLVAPAMCSCLVIGAGAGLFLERAGVARWAVRGGARATAIVAAGLLLLVVGIVFEPGRHIVSSYRNISPGTLAENWVHANIPSGTKIYHCGRFVDGPRLVAKRETQQRQWADYFEYGRTNYHFLRRAFAAAYADYRAQKRPVYDLEATAHHPEPVGTKKLPRWLSRGLDRHAIEHGEEYIILAGFRGVENVLDLHYDWFARVELLQQFGQIAIFRVPSSTSGEGLVNAVRTEVPPQGGGARGSSADETSAGENSGLAEGAAARVGTGDAEDKGGSESSGEDALPHFER